MSGLTKRDYPLNPMDKQIFKNQIKRALQSSTGLLTVSWRDAQQLTQEVMEEISNEAAAHESFDEYFNSF